MYLCVDFNNLAIGFWNCFDSFGFFVFNFISAIAIHNKRKHIYFLIQYQLSYSHEYAITFEHLV